jgi:hypothetical protein
VGPRLTARGARAAIREGAAAARATRGSPRARLAIGALTAAGALIGAALEYDEPTGGGGPAPEVAPTAADDPAGTP